jgi:hypothetical protein
MTRSRDTADTQDNLGGAVPPFAAGKNKIINGDFNINQRAFTSTTTLNAYGFDRWNYTWTGGTATYSAQTFTAGTAPVAGYEAANFARIVTTGQSAVGDLAIFRQPIENVRTFAGQTVTFSFWAKAGTGTPKIGLELRQAFGTGGSPSSVVENPLGAVTISTSWARYSLTYTMPSLSGKTVGTDANSSGVYLGMWVSAGSTYATRSSSIGIQNNTFDIWGVQVEAGSVATAFQTATGTIQGELAACQRYYQRISSNATATLCDFGALALASGTTTAEGYGSRLAVAMRVTPTSLDYANVGVRNSAGTTTGVTVLTIAGYGSTEQAVHYSITVASGLTANNSYGLVANSSSSAYVGFSAEL